MVHIVLLVAIATCALIIGLMAFLDRRSDYTGNQYFTLFSLSITVWCAAVLCIYLFPDDERLVFFAAKLSQISIVGVFGHGAGYVFQTYKRLIPFRAVLFTVSSIATIIAAADSLLVPIKVSFSDQAVFFTEPPVFFTLLLHGYKIFILTLLLVVSILMFKKSQFKRDKIPSIVIAFIVLLTFRIVVLHIMERYPQHLQIYSVVPILLMFFYLSYVSRATALKISNFTDYLYTSVKTPIALLSPAGDFSLMNKSASYFFGLSADELAGIKFETLFKIENPYRIGDHAEAGEEIHIKRQAVYTLNNAACDIDITSIYDGYGELLCSVVVINDVSAEMALIEQLKEMNSVAVKINEIAGLLMSINTHDDFDKTVQTCLQNLGVFAKRNRVYIWKNHSDSGGRLCCSLLYEWSQTAEPQITNPEMQNVVYDEESLPLICASLKAHATLNMLVKDMSQSERAMLERQNIKALLLSPIIIANDVWGYIGFDNCVTEQLFPAAEEQILQITGALFASAILKNEVAKKLERSRARAQAASEAKSNFLANMSHEIRTPLNAILGLSELVLRDEVPRHLRENILGIKQSTSNLLSIINDILDFSKIESGHLEVVPAEYKLSSLINDIVTITRVRITDKPLLFDVRLDSNLPDTLFGDDVRIKQVLINLLTNAVKYTERGRVSLHVTGKTRKKSLSLCFEIEDTGTGIHQKDLKTLFDNFVQLDMKKNRAKEGSGLGLPISKKLCELMNGTISVKSVYGKGSVFTVDLPQKIVNKTKIAAVPAGCGAVIIYELRDLYASSIEYALKGLGVEYVRVTAYNDFFSLLGNDKYRFAFISGYVWQETGSIFERLISVDSRLQIVVFSDFGARINAESIKTLIMPVYCVPLAQLLCGCDEAQYENKTQVKFVAPEARVLIVDDNNMNLLVASGLLTPYRMHVDTCVSAKKAFELLENNVYDLIFMDHMMPEMDGVEAVKIIRAREGAYYKKVPIIAFSANALRGAREMFIENGFTDFLSKPIEISQLNAVLDLHLDKSLRLKNLADAASLPESPEQNGLEQISALDTARGISLTGGTFEGYQRALRIFCSDTRERLPLINMHRRKNDELVSFILNAHALKGSLATIGARSLWQKAEELELAGKNNDRKTISALVPAFIRELRNLLAAITHVLPSENSGSRQNIAGILESLCGALAVFDIDQIDTLVGRLTAAAGNGPPAADIEQAVLEGAYERARLIAGEFLQQL